MASTYAWDLGFDFNAVPYPAGSTTRFLANGFVAVQQGGNTTASRARLLVNDSIGFNAFNITDPLPAGAFYIQSGAITISKADPSQPDSPFVDSGGNPITSITIPTLAAPGMGFSTIFPGTLPFYACVTPQQLTQAGRFLVSLMLTVQGPSGGPITFRVDPEMIVEAGPPTST